MIISRYKPRSYTNELSVVADNIFEEYRYKNDDGQPTVTKSAYFYLCNTFMDRSSSYDLDNWSALFFVAIINDPNRVDKHYLTSRGPEQRSAINDFDLPLHCLDVQYFNNIHVMWKIPLT